MHQHVHRFLLAFLLLVSSFEPVYFDDWHITLTENPKSEIVQEVHYDPWGLVMQDESYFAPPSGRVDCFSFYVNNFINSSILFDILAKVPALVFQPSKDKIRSIVFFCMQRIDGNHFINNTQFF